MFKKYPLILTTGARNLYYTHSQHRNIKGLRERSPEAYGEIHPKTAKKYGVKRWGCDHRRIESGTDQGEGAGYGGYDGGRVEHPSRMASGGEC